MKKPEFLKKLSAVLSPSRPTKRLKATARAARPSAMDDYDENEPTTRLSSAFIVVLILHVVAVGGIYAFNSIKASRKDREAAHAPVAAAAPVKPAVPTKAADAVEKAASAVSSKPASAIEPSALMPGTVATTKPAAVGSKPYIIKTGDNLTRIAFAYNLTAAEVAAANGIKETAILQPGNSLNIPAAAKTPLKPTAADTAKALTNTKVADIPPTKTTPGLYTVKKGDTATSIAKRFGIKTAELAKLNKLTDPTKITAGQTLKVPAKKD